MARKKRYTAHIEGRKRKDCILIVCPGSHDQSGAKLKASLEAIAESFQSCRLFLADTLDRHNTNSKAARARGDLWLTQHKAMLGNLLDDMVRWDEVKADPSFSGRYQAITSLYETNASAHAAISDICEQHTNLVQARVQAKGQAFDREDYKRRSVAYMIEEVAGLAVIRSWTNAPEVYPGLYFDDPLLFTRLAPDDVSLTLPRVYPVRFEPAAAASLELSKAA